MYTNVAEFAVGDGETDDSAAFQAAIDTLTPSGGALYVPPNRRYALGSKVSIKSLHSIWIVSTMSGAIRGGGALTTHANSGLIRPLNDLDYMFEWDTPAGKQAFEAGGGGVQGLAFCDVVPPATTRGKTISGAIHLKAATKFHINECNFEWLKGRAVRFGLNVYCQIRNSKAYNCGDTSKPTFDLLADGAGELALVWVDRLFAESCTYGSPTFLIDNGTLYGNGIYFEDGINNNQSYIDASGGGLVNLDNFWCKQTGVTSIKLNGPHSYLTNGEFNNIHGTNPQLEVAAGAFQSRFNNLLFKGGPDGTSTGVQIQASAAYCQWNLLHLEKSGRIANAGVKNIFKNVEMYWPQAAAGTYAIDLAAGSQLSNAIIDGTTTSVCHGIRAAGSTVSNCHVDLLDGGNGIVSTLAADNIKDNTAENLNGGTPFTYVNGTKAAGNIGYTRTASDGDSDDAITLNAETCMLTTKSLTTADDGTTYLLTWNNTLINLESEVSVTVGRGGGMSQGFPALVDVQRVNGAAFIRIKNSALGSGDFNGPVNIFASVRN